MEQLYAKKYVIGLLLHSYLVLILHDIKQLQEQAWAGNSYIFCPCSYEESL